MNSTDRVVDLLRRCGQPDGVLPPTALFNEGWMLRLVLDWASRHPHGIAELPFHEGSQWYSEALLPSRFKPRVRGDSMGEGFTHADGVIGHFRRPGRRGDIALLPDARQFLVVEAKMASGLSAGTTRAPSFNQAARNVACIAHLVASALLPPKQFASLGFLVLAPAERIRLGVFAAVDPSSILSAVRQRAQDFDVEAIDWCRTVFERIAPQIALTVLSWESAIAQIRAAEPGAGGELQEFYEKCLEFNPLKPLAVDGLPSLGG